MRVVEFHGLSRAAQDHFVDSTAGSEPPAPLLVRAGGPTGHRIGWVVAGGALLALVGLAAHGFGDLSSDAVVHPLVLAALWVLLCVAVVYGVLHAVAGERQVRVLPWKAGIYAFPGVTIDARTHDLRVFEVDELRGIESAPGGIALVYEGERFVFAASPGDVAAARAAIEREQQSGPPSDPNVRASRDPISEPRMSSPLAPTHRRHRVVPAWAKLRGLIAIAVGVAAGLLLFFARNVTSDDRAFDSARARDDVAAYRAYLKHGARHHDEVARTLLPRAELEGAKKAGTVDAILAFRRSHPASAIEGEVDAALKRSLLAELETAKKEGTLAAVAAFESKRPNHGLDAEVKEAVHQVYVAAFASFKARANDKDPAVIAFFQRVLDFAEAHHEPKVEIRVRPLPSTSLGRADKYVASEPHFMGETSYPTRYFQPTKVAPFAAAFAKDLAEELGKAFPAEVLSFSVGAPVEGELPTPTVPTLLVSHHEEWTGIGYPSNRPRGIYVGVNFHFQSSFRIPGDKQPLESKAMIARPVSMKLVGEHAKAPPALGEVEKAVYEAMTKEGFDAFEGKLLAQIFRR